MNVDSKLVSASGYAPYSTALYFYGASKKSLHQPRVTFGSMLIKINFSPIYYLCTAFVLSVFLKNLPDFLKIHFWHQIVLFLKSLLYQFTIVKIVHLQNNTFTY
jgi:hypothetical protein